MRTKQDLSYISICLFSILYNSEFVLMAMSLGTNAVVVTRVHCIQVGYGNNRHVSTCQLSKESDLWRKAICKGSNQN